MAQSCFDLPFRKSKTFFKGKVSDPSHQVQKAYTSVSRSVFYEAKNVTRTS